MGLSDHRVFVGEAIFARCKMVVSGALVEPFCIVKVMSMHSACAFHE